MFAQTAAGHMKPSPMPFTLAVPEADLEDLRARLARTRFPDEPPLAPWSTGTSFAWLKGLVEDRRSRFDWRAPAARTYTNIQRWTVEAKGGHFAALEQPEVLAREIRAFFRPLREPSAQ